MSSRPSLHDVVPGARPVLERLWQLYWHDLSEFRGMLPGEDGLFGLAGLPSYFDHPDRRAYLVTEGSVPVGFALVRGVVEGPRLVGEFFVVRAARRRRVGQGAALELLARHPGRWEVPFQEENSGAARFWRGVATAAAGEAWWEERRPVPGKPHLPPDVWLTLDTAAAPAGGPAAPARG